MDTKIDTANRRENIRLKAVSILAPSNTEARRRINDAFLFDGLGSVLPDMWEKHSVYYDGIADGELVISLRVVLPSEIGLPIDHHFSTSDLCPEGPCAEISHFTVLLPFRRRIAVYDWDSVKQHARDAGCRHLIVESLMSLERFYRRLGFSRCGNPFFDPSIGTETSSMAANAIPMLMLL